MRIERVDIVHARARLADLITLVSEGAKVIITQDGKPIARLIGAADELVYKSLSPGIYEFSSDEEPLTWDANGWEEVT